MTATNPHAWTPALLRYVRLLADEFVQGGKILSDDVDFPGSASTDTPFLQLSRYLASDESNAMASTTLDTNHPLSDYFISSSHNTYLWGNQLYGKASTKAYRNVLERGCRCVEIDVWDGEIESDSSGSSSEGSSGSESEGEMTKLRRRFKKKVEVLKAKAEGLPGDNSTPSAKNNPQLLVKTSSSRPEPRVLHGHTATKEISFRDVCTTIRDYAFTTSDLPLIVSLEVHTCPEQQQAMVDIMKELWAPYLVGLNIATRQEILLPDLESLRKKILIKVKYSSPERARAPESTASSENVELDVSEDEAHADATNKSKIIGALGCMGVYTRSYHFKGLDQPEAKIPTHIFSLSESKLVEVHKHDHSGLFKHNKRFMMRVYPKGIRVSSSNLDPAPFWRMGAQIVALNWQYVNAAMMLNQGMFQSTDGFVLKPDGYRNSHAAESQLSALKRGQLDLSIEFFAGQSIGPIGEKLRPYIRCELHVEDLEEITGEELPEGGKTKDGQIKASTEVGRGGRNPDFARQILRFKGVPDVSEELTFLRIKIMDEDTFSRDNMVAWACFRLNRLQTGVRILHLYGTDGQPTDGMLLVRTSKSIKIV